VHTKHNSVKLKKIIIFGRKPKSIQNVAKYVKPRKKDAEVLFLEKEKITVYDCIFIKNCLLPVFRQRKQQID
jgi:hypothetical protein